MTNRQDSFKISIMKKFLLSLLLVCTIHTITAQDQDIDRAKRYYERTYYSEAIPLYETAVNENVRTLEVIRNLADSYYFTNDMRNAQKYYQFLVKSFSKDLPAEYYFRLSQTLKSAGNINDANKVIRDYLNTKEDKIAIANFERELKTLGNVIEIGERFKIKNLAINTPNSEFGAVKLGEKLVYSSTKKDPGVFDKVYKWNNESYLNLVTISYKNINKKDSIPTYFSKDVNTKLHESNAVFTLDGKTMYFTRNNTKNKDKVSNLQIFKSELINGKWTNEKSLPFNSLDYSTEHPALSPDGKTLYFASDMPDSKGSFDIYSVEIIGNDYGTPKNLGDKVNTPRKEQFPFVSNDNKLYFSSNGHEGFGSLDVFVTDIATIQTANVLNVGLPVNSNFDDFAFNINSDTKEGFFASNRKGGKGGDDIYSLQETKPLIVEDCSQIISGIITDVDSKLPIENATLILHDINKKQISTQTTATDGSFKFDVECQKQYILEVSKSDYTSNSQTLRLQKERKKVNDASMTIRSLEKIRQEELIALENKKKADIESEKERLKIEQHEKKNKKEKKEGKPIDIVKKKDDIERIVADENNVKLDDKKRLVIDLNPVFDYSLWYIRRDTKPLLDKVYALMIKYPKMNLEVQTHTDSRGNAESNRSLSQKRAQSVKDYIVAKGIDAGRIKAIGYGESKPIVKCKNDNSCSEEEHELNRRCEFVVNDF
jgi:outer membrane protein OmpA-like peptidoglycan-associated protein/tetratricopeptide (TPR) repeat protein